MRKPFSPPPPAGPRSGARASFSEQAVAQLLHNVLSAVAYMHEHRVVHRDIKPSNVLVERALPTSLIVLRKSLDLLTGIKVADFGFARVVDPRDSLTGCCGTPYYIAPEILRCGYYQDGPAYGLGCDLWSLGVLGYVLLTGAPPFQARARRDLIAAIVEGHWAFPVACAVSEPCRDFFGRLLVPDPAARLTAAAALQHPWIQDRSHNADLHLPAVQAAVCRFGRSVGSQNSSSWVHAAALPLAPLPARPRLKKPRVDLCTGGDCALDALHCRPSAAQLDVRRDRWRPTVAKKALQVLQETLSIRTVQGAGGTTVPAARLRTIEEVVPLNASVAGASRKEASGRPILSDATNRPHPPTASHVACETAVGSETTACRARHNQMAQGSAEAYTGCSRFLLSCDCAWGRYWGRPCTARAHGAQW